VQLIPRMHVFTYSDLGSGTPAPLREERMSGCDFVLVEGSKGSVSGWTVAGIYGL